MKVSEVSMQNHGEFQLFSLLAPMTSWRVWIERRASVQYSFAMYRLPIDRNSGYCLFALVKNCHTGEPQMAVKEIRQIEPMIMKAIREAIPLNEVFALMDQHS